MGLAQVLVDESTQLWKQAGGVTTPCADTKAWHCWSNRGTVGWLKLFAFCEE